MPIKQEILVGSFHDLLSSVITLNHLRRENVSASTIKALPVSRFRYEYCTVKIDVGRQSGKSEYIRRNADKETLIVVRKEIHKDEYRECGATLVTMPELLRTKMRGRKPFKAIFFDEPAFMFRDRRDIDEVYQILSYSNIYQTFIHIGC